MIYFPLISMMNKPQLLDTYPATAAYSLRKIRQAYAGNAIRIRRSSDNTEQDIGFVGNNLDTSSIVSFVGANNGFVTTWYDQSGNGYNVTQAISTSQPAIVISGTILTINSKPTVRFDGTNDFLENTTNIINATNPAVSIFSVSSKSARDNASNDFMTQIGIGSVATTSFYLPYRTVNNTNTTQFRASGGTNSRTYTASDYVNNTTYLLSSIDNGANVILYRNNSTILASSATSLGVFNPGGAIGYRIGHVPGSGASFWKGEVSEMIIYNSSQASNITPISNNINNHYVIY